MKKNVSHSANKFVSFRFVIDIYQIVFRPKRNEIARNEEREKEKNTRSKIRSFGISKSFYWLITCKLTHSCHFMLPQRNGEMLAAQSTWGIPDTKYIDNG